MLNNVMFKFCFFLLYMFISLKLTNQDVLVEKFYQKGIPEDFTKIWESASNEPFLKD